MEQLISQAVVAYMLESLHTFFTSSPFLPHGHCYLWNPMLIWLHGVSDVLIALAYYSIPFTLLYFLHQRKDFAFKSVFLLFGVLSIAAGTTHLMSVWALWYPNYWLFNVVKAITALVSVYTAFILVDLMPKALEISSTAEAALRRAYDELEIRVQERTAELLGVNQALQQEIAERQRVEATLRNTTTLQRAILDSANYTIISTTPDGIIQTFNAAAQRWLGYSPEEVVGKVTPAIIHDWDKIVQVAQELSQELGVTIEPGFEVFVAKARRGHIYEREWTYIRKDGSRFPVLLSVTALRDAENNITGFLGIGSDISKRKADEEALRRSEHRYASLAQAAPVGIFRSDTSGRCIFINEQACAIIGSSKEEILGEGWIQFLHPEDRQRVLREWYQTVQKNLPFKSEYRFCDRNGRNTWVISQAIAETESTGEITGYIGTIIDITENLGLKPRPSRTAFVI